MITLSGQFAPLSRTLRRLRRGACAARLSCALLSRRDRLALRSDDRCAMTG
jgi:hypothetical protein